MADQDQTQSEQQGTLESRGSAPRARPWVMKLGLVFLAHNLGFVPFGALREFFSTWWPLILIAVGVAGLARRR